MKRKTLISSILTIALCLSLIAGSTYALFTSQDEVNIAVNAAKVEVTADIDQESLKLFSMDKAITGSIFENGGSASFSETTGDLTLTNITPGDKVTFEIDVVNGSNVAIQYRLTWNVTGDLADALVATVGEEAVALNEPSTSWKLWENGDSITLPVSIELPVTTVDTYQEKGVTISFKVEAIQGNAFTGDADYYVFSEAELVAALAEIAGSSNYDEEAAKITLMTDCNISAPLNISKSVVINGGGYTIAREEGFTGTVFSADAGATLTLADVVVDGGAVWTGEIDPTLGRGTVNSGVAATGNLIYAKNKAQIVLDEGAILQNNVGAHAVYLDHSVKNTKLVINGGEIINNASGSGAVWGGGAIILNAGKISNNSSTGFAGAIRMVSACNLTINGGEINHNKAAGDGGVIWGSGSSTYTFTGGEMAYNVSGGVGGAIYTGTYSNINISGTFEMHDNSATNSGAIRLTDHTSLTMTGGKIYNNKQNGESNAFNTWNNSMTIVGGEIWDNFVFIGGLGLTIGAADIEGVISYNLSTNHNTAYLAADFKGFSFTANEGEANFANFNFKPAAGYTYTEGDEDKLVCLNDGYETYWDAATGTFRLQATN